MSESTVQTLKEEIAELRSYVEHLQKTIDDLQKYVEYKDWLKEGSGEDYV
jgi:archaellum component FlaC